MAALSGSQYKPPALPVVYDCGLVTLPPTLANYKEV